MRYIGKVLFVLVVVIVSVVAVYAEEKVMYCDMNVVYEGVSELKAAEQLQADYEIQLKDALIRDIEQFRKENDYFTKKQSYLLSKDEYSKLLMRDTNKGLTATEKEKMKQLETIVNKLAEDLNEQDAIVEGMKAKVIELAEGKKAAIKAKNNPWINKAIENVGIKYRAHIDYKPQYRLYVAKQDDATPYIIDEIKRIIQESTNK